MYVCVYIYIYIYIPPLLGIRQRDRRRWRRGGESGRGGGSCVDDSAAGSRGRLWSGARDTIEIVMLCYRIYWRDTIEIMLLYFGDLLVLLISMLKQQCHHSSRGLIIVHIHILVCLYKCVSMIQQLAAAGGSGVALEERCPTSAPCFPRFVKTSYAQSIVVSRFTKPSVCLTWGKVRVESFTSRC